MRTPLIVGSIVLGATVLTVAAFKYIQSAAVAPLTKPLSVESSLSEGEELLPPSEELKARVSQSYQGSTTHQGSLHLLAAYVSSSGDIGLKIEKTDKPCEITELSERIGQAGEIGGESGGLGRKLEVCLPASLDFATTTDLSKAYFLSNDQFFEGQVELKVASFRTSANMKVALAGYFWCPSELEESDTCIAGLVLTKEPDSPSILAPARSSLTGSTLLVMAP